MLPGRSVFTFIVTLWREPDASDSEPETWRGSARPVLPKTEDDTQPPAIPFIGLAAVSDAIQRGLQKMMGPRT